MAYTEGKTDCKPAEVDYDESRIQALNKHFQGLINDGEIQGASYCVSRYGKVFMHGAIGQKSFKQDDKTPLTPDCVYYIASLTKVFTAVAIMKLVEDGVTRLDVPVGEILPQFNTPPFNAITLFHLLTHTSGLHADPSCFDNKYQSSYWGIIETAYERRKPDYCWKANVQDRGYGIGFDMRNGPAFTFSHGTFMHEGWGYCSLYIDPEEELAAAWFVPFTRDEWFSRAQYSVQNVIWSGLM